MHQTGKIHGHQAFAALRSLALLRKRSAPVESGINRFLKRGAQGVAFAGAAALATPLAADDADLPADESDLFNVSVGAPEWRPAMLENGLKLGNSRYINGLIAGIDPAFVWFPNLPALLSGPGDEIALGFDLDGGYGNQGSQVNMTYLGGGVPSIFAYSYSESAFGLMAPTSAVFRSVSTDVYNGGSSARYGLEFVHEMRPLRRLASSFERLGLRLGVAFSYEELRVERFGLLIESATTTVNGVTDTVVSTTTNRGALFQNTLSAANIVLGVGYELGLSEDLRLDLALDYRHSGYAAGRNQVNSGYFLQWGTAAFPISNKLETGFDPQLEGYTAEFGIAYRLTETFSLRLYGRHSEIQYRLRNVRTDGLREIVGAFFQTILVDRSTPDGQARVEEALTRGTIGTALRDLGPIPAAHDRVNSVGIEVQTRF